MSCLQDGDTDPRGRDSVGARNDFEVGQSLSSGDTIWQIEAEPTLVLGLLEGPPEHLFSQIRGATRLSNGTVVVLDGASSQLRAFSPDGTHLWTAGGPGEGPGEMRNPTHLETLPGDTLQVQDGLSRIRYGADGSVVADEQLPVEELLEFGRYYAWECPVPGFVGNRVLACAGGGFDALDIPRKAGPWRGETELALLPWTLDSIAPLGVFLMEEAWALAPEKPLDLPEGITVLSGTGLGLASPPMSRKGLFAVGGWPRRLVVADSWGDRMHAFDLGADHALPVATIPIRRVRRPPTDDELAAAWKTASRWSRNSPEYLREHLPAPDSIPNVDHLLVDDLGTVWVGSYRADASATRLYHVYDPEGPFLVRVTMPAGVEVLEIGADYVLGITRDALDVERVVLLNLARNP
ncbi:MAG: hypothetical protein OXL34_17100 [Gemmatimonadota bacterium]|nr:hypothetical protein [Gemmatimonadota bacterium]